ncbi:MAG: glycerophosphodiester phosphodiesterase family protein, partial [Anaerolineales bacterium]|nr:glycerophosphodiester phosphodiesterase family protein [Anaerolineales bacterium]
GALSVYPFDLTPEADIERVGVFWLAPILDPTLVARTHRRGLDLWVWTVDHPWLIRSLDWLGVDGITSNDPDLALEILSQ